MLAHTLTLTHRYDILSIFPGFPTPPLAGFRPPGLPDLAGMGLPGLMPPPFPPIPTAPAINPFINRITGLVSW